MLTIYDGNNVFRRRLNNDATGLPLRNLFRETQKTDGAVIWTFDGFNSNQRRRDIYPEYKVSREPAGENVYATLTVFKDILKYSKALIIEVPWYEADDVIVTLTRKYRDRLPISIQSNDADLVPMSMHPNVSINRDPWTKCDIKDIQLYKTLVGDRSDNIPGVKGFGEKTFAILDKEAMYRWIDGEDVTAGQLNVSAKMFDRLQEYRSEILTYWQIISPFEVPDDLIAKHTTTGKTNTDAAMQLCAQHWL